MDKGIDQTLNYLPLGQIQTDSLMSDFIGRFYTQEISPLTLQSFSENFPIYQKQFRYDQLLNVMRLQPTTQESNKSSLMDPDSVSRPSKNKPNSRKRKSIPSPASSSLTASNSKISDQNCASIAPKRSKKEANKNTDKKDDDTKVPEPHKDYIHVRARRGQATDSHSLAERARREKISERMKFLQDLVPGCNKITGKAVMLDEIINYVQSLQTQVEFLAMKLATINPRFELNSNSILSTELTQCMYSEERYSSGCLAIDKNQLQLTSLSTSMPSSDGFVQVPTLWENDLESIVQMGFGDSQHESLICTERNVEMKLELER